MALFKFPHTPENPTIIAVRIFSMIDEPSKRKVTLEKMQVPDLY